jgi:hypothetical protein
VSRKWLSKSARNCASSRPLDLEINLHRHVSILSPASYPIFPSTHWGAILILFFYFLNSKINFCIEDSVKKIIQTSENYAFLLHFFITLLSQTNILEILNENT